MDQQLDGPRHFTLISVSTINVLKKQYNKTVLRWVLKQTETNEIPLRVKYHANIQTGDLSRRNNAAPFASTRLCPVSIQAASSHVSEVFTTEGIVQQIHT